MISLYDSVARQLSGGKKGVLATVVNRTGSAPREEGAKMWVGEDGEIVGTIGGGILEAEIIAEALKTMNTEAARMISIGMDAKAVADEGMLCGGTVDILLEPVLATHREVYSGLQECERRGINAILVTRLNRAPVRKCLIDREGTVWGDPINETEIAGFGDPWSGKQIRLLDRETVIERLTACPRLYLFGAGHVSQYLSRIAKMVDFHVTVIDDREEFANRDRFPEADSVLVEDFGEVFNRLDFSREPYLVIVTRGHRHDALVLEKSLEKPACYIGMIGSRRKVRLVFDYLREKGVKNEILESVHAPIGLDINSETPQEIAVSIVAELIQTRGKKRLIPDFSAPRLK